MRVASIVLALLPAATGCDRRLVFEDVRCQHYGYLAAKALGRGSTAVIAGREYCMAGIVDPAMVTCVLQKHAAGELDLCDDEEARAYR